MHVKADEMRLSVTAMTSVYLPVLQGVAVKAPMSNPFKLNGGVIPLKL